MDFFQVLGIIKYGLVQVLDRIKYGLLQVLNISLPPKYKSHLCHYM